MVEGREVRQASAIDRTFKAGVAAILAAREGEEKRIRRGA